MIINNHWVEWGTQHFQTHPYDHMGIMMVLVCLDGRESAEKEMVRCCCIMLYPRISAHLVLHLQSIRLCDAKTVLNPYHFTRLGLFCSSLAGQSPCDVFFVLCRLAVLSSAADCTIGQPKHHHSLLSKVPRSNIQRRDVSSKVLENSLHQFKNRRSASATMAYLPSRSSSTLLACFWAISVKAVN